MLDLLKYLADGENKFGRLGEWAQQIRSDFRKKDILFLLALHFRAAREGETENYFGTYVSHIKKILKKSQRTVSESETNYYADLLSEHPDLSSEDKKFSMMLLDIAHRSDHLRQTFWDVPQSVKDQQFSIGINGQQDLTNQNDIIHFLQERAGSYLKATGAYNKMGNEKPIMVGGYGFSNPKLFGELEHGPGELYQVMEGITLDKGE